MKFTSFARLFGTGRQQKTRRGRRTTSASLAKWDRLVHPRLENLEDRTVLSVLPTPQVVNSGVIAAGGMNGNLNSSATAVDPLNPNDVVSIFSLHDETVTGNQKSFVEGRFSTDGGVTWSPLSWAAPQLATPCGGGAFLPNLLDPNPVNPGNNPRMPLQDAIDPSVSFGINPSTGEHDVYVLYSENSRDHQYGSIVLSKFNFPPGGVPVLQPVNSMLYNTLYAQRPYYQCTQQLYTWGFQGTDGGGLGFDAVLNPTIAVDNAVAQYRDPISGQLQRDPYAGTVYVAFNTNYRPPNGAQINPNAILVMAAVPQADGTLPFSTPKFLNFTGFSNMTERDANPQLAISQGTAASRPTVLGSVPGGLVTAVWDDFGTPAQRNIVSNQLTSGGVGYFALGSLGGDPSFPDDGQCTDPSGAVVGMVTHGAYCNAIHPMMGNDIPVTTTFDVDVPASAVQMSNGNVTGINVTLDIEDQHLQDLKAVLVGPDGTQYLLFNNFNNPGGMSNSNGLSSSGPNLGVSAPNLAQQASEPPSLPRILWDTVFDPLAPRTITQAANDAVMVPFSGHFRPAGTLPTSLRVGGLNNQVIGTWKLQITQVQNHSMDMPHPQRVWKWAISFTQHLVTQTLPDSILFAGAGGMNPPPMSPLVGARYGTMYPLKPAAFPDHGIGPNVVIAADNTLGAYSPFQGRIYVAYTGVGLNSGNVPAQPHTDTTDIFLMYSIDGGITWTLPQRVNDDDPLDGFSEGNRPKFQPQIAVDQTTGTLVISYRDGRYDAARARVVTTIATSIDGGHSFQDYVTSQGQQPYLNPAQTAGDAITGKTVNVQPIPDNASAANGGRDTLFAWGDYMGLAVASGHVFATWGGNGNGGNYKIYTAQVVIADGPRVVSSDMGPIARASVLQLQDGTTPVPYNSTYGPDGTQMVDGFVVTFDRPIADGRSGVVLGSSYNHGMSTLTPADITVIFHDTVTPQSQLGTIIPVLSVTPVVDSSTTAPLVSYGSGFLTLAEQFLGANKFLIRFQPQSRVGTYSYVIGPTATNKGPMDLVRAPGGDPTGLGNQMDQNANATAGELPTTTFGGDSYAAPAPVNNGPNFLAPYSQLTQPLIVPGPHIVTTFVPGSPASADNLVSSGFANCIDIVFDRDMDPNSIDFQSVLRMVGPVGPIAGPFSITPDPNPVYPRLINGNMTSAVDPDPSHPRTYKITFPAQQLNGSFSITLASSIRSAHGDQVDVNQNAGLDILRDVPSGGTRNITYNFSDPNQVVHTPTTLTAPLTVPDDFVIQGVTVGLNINTQDVRDLSAYLQAPDGTRIQLFTNVGANGTSFVNFTNTVFSDSATGGPGSLTNPIQGGQAPFTGTYNPQQPLSTLVGKASAGTYLLVVTSRTSINGFQTAIVNWSLTLTRPIPITGLGELVADQSTVSFRIFSLAKGNSTSSKTWTAVGPAGIGEVDPITKQTIPSTHSGRIGGIAVDPSDPSGNTVYVAGASGGVWKSTNFLTTALGGPTYVPLTDSAPTFGLNIGGISVFGRNNDPRQSIIFIVTGEGDTSGQLPGVGFLRSMDGGNTWTLLDSTDNTLPYAQRDHRFVGTTAFKVVADPTPTPSGQTLVYAALSGTNGGIWRSTDAGNTWSLMRAGQATDVVLAAGSADAASGNLRIIYGAFRGEGVFMSDTAGTRWNLLAGGQGILWYDVRRNTYVTVAAPASTPNGAKGRITLAAPALVPSTVPNSRLQNLEYQGWLYALVSTPAGQEDGLYVTKDFGQNWTQIKVNLTPARAGVLDTVFPTNNDTDPVLNILGSTRAPQGNYNQSLVVDPTNPNVVYVGGTQDFNPTGLIRVDTTGMADARALLAHNNLRADGGALQNNTTGPTVLGGGQGGPYGLVDPASTVLLPVLYNQPHWLNLINDPFNPFLFNSTQLVANLDMNGTVLSQSNLGIQVKWIPYDTGVLASTDQHRVWTMIDPLTGMTRLIFGDDQGLFSVIDPGDGTTNFLTGVGTAQANSSPSRNGNLQITQFYGGASQPSQLAANIANALLYGEAQDDGFPLSDPNLLKNGNIQWTGPDGDGQWVGTDQTGSGNVFESRWPCCQGGEGTAAVSTDFFRFNRNTSRTFGLFLNPPPDAQNWPDTFGANAAINPVNGNQLLISSNLGNVFRTDSAGFQWFLIGSGTDLDSSNAQALAYGAPDPNDPTGATDNFIWAGTIKGHIYVTLDGGGTWTNLSTGLDGSSVESIVTNPHRGTHEAYAVTSTGVFHISFSVTLNPATHRLVISGTPTWQNITGNLFQLSDTSLGDPTFVQQALRSLTSVVADWRFAILDDPSNPTGPTHPVLYVGGNGGVVRSLDGGKTWTIFPDMADDGAPTDGGYFPRVMVTHLDLAIGDVNPQTGLTLQATSPDMLFATTYGRGLFAIRITAPQATEEVFVTGLDSRVYGQKLDSRGNPGGPYFQTSPSVVKSIVTGHDSSGQPLVFAIGLDNQVYYQRFDQNGNPIGDFAATAPGAIKTFTISNDATGNPELFVIGLDNQVYALNFDANDNPVGGYFLTALGAVKFLTVSHDAQGRPELFVTGLDNQIYARRFDANGQPLANETYFLTQAGQVKSFSVGQNATNQPEIFAIGLDSQVYAQQFDDNGLSASVWFLAVSPPGGGARLVKSVTFGHDANNNPILFVTGLNDNIYLADLDPNGNPSSPDYSLAAPGAVKGFKVGYDANNIPEIFAIGLDDQVYYELFNTPGTPTGTYHLMNRGQVKSLTVTQ